MTRLALKDELLDAQLIRAVGSALYGGADLGECLRAARDVHGDDLDSWYDAWLGLAEAVTSMAHTQERAGRRETAKLAYLRASTYFRTAGVMLMGLPLDPRLVSSNLRHTESFHKALALMDHPSEVLEIPFEDTTLPAYFLRVSEDHRPRATVLLTGGYDGTAEELYLLNGAAALERGYNVLAFDGPGQGAALIQGGMTMRPDWEHVIGPVIDYLVTRSDVDADRIALIGLSLGAHLAPRAASEEHRLAACIADCGAFDLYEGFLQRLPGPLAAKIAKGNKMARSAVAELTSLLMRKPTAGWGLRRGLLVHGVDDALAYLDCLKEYSLAGRAEKITCPTWVCSAEGDDISASAPQLVDALTCPHGYVKFTAAEGADDHCEQAARALYHARSFGWLDELLHPRN